MSDGAVIRDLEPSDIEDIKRIHEASGIDYQLPNLFSPLFLVKKALVVDGQVRMCVGGYLTSEAYLFIDHTEWADPEQKLVAIKELERLACEEARAKGLEEVILYLPPEMERFGRRLIEDLGFSRDRASWQSYSKKL